MITVSKEHSSTKNSSSQGSMRPQELLTYEIFDDGSNLYISIPGHNLINPRFLLKKNTLFIFLYDYSHAYKLSGLQRDVIKAIINKNCFLQENLNQENIAHHPIRLYP